MPQDSHASNPFHRASEAANAVVVKLEHNADVRDNSGTPPLQHLAMAGKRLKTIQIILGCNADVTSRNSKELDPSRRKPRDCVVSAGRHALCQRKIASEATRG